MSRTELLVGASAWSASSPLGVLDQVDSDDARALRREQPGRLGADAARRSGDHADLSVQAAGHPAAARVCWFSISPPSRSRRS